MTEEKKNIPYGYIGNALRSAASDGVTTFADEVFDTDRQEYQSVINENLDAAINNETARAQAAEQELTVAIQQETERATASESALDENITRAQEVEEEDARNISRIGLKNLLTVRPVNMSYRQTTMQNLVMSNGIITFTNFPSGKFVYVNFTQDADVEEGVKYICRIGFVLDIDAESIQTNNKMVVGNGENHLSYIATKSETFDFRLDFTNISESPINGTAKILYVEIFKYDELEKNGFNEIPLEEGVLPAKRSADGTKALVLANKIAQELEQKEEIKNVNWKHFGDSLANSFWHSFLVSSSYSERYLTVKNVFFDLNTFGHGGGTIDAIATDILKNETPQNAGNADINRDADIVTVMAGTNDFYRINNPRYSTYHTTLGSMSDILNFGEISAYNGSDTIIQHYVNLCRILRAKYEGKIIALIGIPEGDMYVNGGLSYDKTFYRSRLNELAKQACAITGVHFIDISGCGISADNMTGFPNLYNKETITDGYYINSEGTLVEEEGSYVTDFIPVEQNKTYVGCYNDNKDISLYNSEKTFIKTYSGIKNTIITHPTLAPITSDTGYIRVSLHRSVNDVDGTIIESSKDYWIAEDTYATMPDRTHPNRLGITRMMEIIVPELYNILQNKKI